MTNKALARPGDSKKPSNKSSSRTQSAPSKRQSIPSPNGDFHNPYNFVPALPRDKAIEQKSELGDRHPAGHGVYQPGLWSGQISIHLTTKTPLLIPDAAIAEEIKEGKSKGHKTFKTRTDADGLPLLPSTSIKGMLRAAYEIITNSRLSIFEKHGDRLAYRMPPQMSVIPARVTRLDDDVLMFRLMDIAKLKRYENGPNLPLDKGESSAARRYPNNTLPNHGKAVWVQLDNENEVIQIIPRKKHSEKLGWRKGWVYLTGANIKNKQFERVFLEKEEQNVLVFKNQSENSKKQDRKDVIQLWQDLIKDYKEIHEKDLKQRQENGVHPGAYLGDEPGKTGWSQHIYDENSESLKQGTLCYVEIDSNNRITAVVPVIISRHLYKVAPDKLLDKTLCPPEAIDDLSPTDRVFGWVRRTDSRRSKFKTAYKGNLRISAVKCLAKNRQDAIKEFAREELPLAILGSPKEEQARFYLAEDDQGTPLKKGIEKAKGYRTGQGLRGRKVYPHHQGLPESHWSEPTRDRTQRSQNDHFQEYRRPRKDGNEQRDDQNRSIKDWVKQDVTFSARIDVTNLSGVELGALLYLLSLPDNHFHRLGGGKPLGFGSVRLDINWEQTDLRRGSDWKTFYETLDESQLNNQSSDPRLTITAYQDEVKAIYGNSEEFENIPFIQAFLQAAKGFDDQKPVHYPRVRPKGFRGGNPPPHPDGESFKWFTENERTGRDGGDRLSLSSLLDESGLPYLDDKDRGR